MLVLILTAVLMQSNTSDLVTIASGSRSGITEARQSTARTPSEWQALWKSHAGGDAAAAVDFAKEMVAAVFLGTRPTGGYRVEILSVRRESDALIIEYAERRPAADAIVTQALTSPFHIVKLPRHSGPVRFRAVTPSSNRL